MKKVNLEPPGAFIESPLTNLIPRNKSNNYFYKNGHAVLIDRLKLKVHSDIEECNILWEKFSTKKSIFDLWDFRTAWYKGYNYKPFFYTLYEGTKPLGFLPLCFNKENKRYEWWGTNWMEDCDFYVNDEKLINLLLYTAPSPLHLNAIKLKYLKIVTRFGKVKKDDNKNEKDISSYHSIQEVMNSYKKKYRHNLKHSCSYIEFLNPKVAYTTGRRADLIDKLISMNIKQFDTGILEDESDLVLSERASAYRKMVENSGSEYEAKFIEIFIQDTLAAIDFILIYKDNYYTIKGGNELKKFDGIGNYMLYLELEDAIKNHMSNINSLQVDYGWKHRYFDQTSLYVFEK
ncbi:MAG: hypothetical protein ABH812_00920 [bacterium]